GQPRARARRHAARKTRQHRGALRQHARRGAVLGRLPRARRRAPQDEGLRPYVGARAQRRRLRRRLGRRRGGHRHRCVPGKRCEKVRADPAALAAPAHSGTGKLTPLVNAVASFANSASGMTVPVSQTLESGTVGQPSRTVPASQRLRERDGGTLAALAGAALALSLALSGAAFAEPESKAEPKVKIAFVGDSTSDGLWGGDWPRAGSGGGFTSRVPRGACLKANRELGLFAKNSTGPTRPQKFDWVEELPRLGESFKPQLFVMSLGLNDRQSVVENGKV